MYGLPSDSSLVSPPRKLIREDCDIKDDHSDSNPKARRALFSWKSDGNINGPPSVALSMISAYGSEDDSQSSIESESKFGTKLFV